MRALEVLIPLAVLATLGYVLVRQRLPQRQLPRDPRLVTDSMEELREIAETCRVEAAMLAEVLKRVEAFDRECVALEPELRSQVRAVLKDYDSRELRLPGGSERN